MNLKILRALLLPVAMAASSASAADFSIGFDWGNLKTCTSGNPSTVPSPGFRLRGVPAGTVAIQFTMTDLAVPNYPHGGGKVAYRGGSAIAAGAFTYRSPCPPNGRHTYRWKATAFDAAGKKLDEAEARKPYP
ncbi:YbhB/YbcL family Raf kinase inhibitor-like protein [Ollibium composti]|nr:YbhB/YbcL family Raf kinase inhibitor-like protein [Mesorhizobium composti]